MTPVNYWGCVSQRKSHGLGNITVPTSRMERRDTLGIQLGHEKNCNVGAGLL